MTLNKLALNNVLRDKWTYFAYFISSAFSVFIFFSFSVAMFHPDLSVIEGGSALSMAMMFGNVLVYLFSFLFISYSIRSFLKSRMKTFGLFVITGASKKQLNSIIFKENMIIGMAAIITAVTAGLVVSPLILLVTRNIIHADGFAMYLPVNAILLTTVLFLILFLLISFITPMFLRKQKIIQMLKAERASEKEIKFSVVETLFCILLLAGGVGVISFMADTLNSTLGVLALIGIFLIGLYLLYRQVFIMILNTLRKKGLYKRKTNMLIISDLRSKLRSNVNVMFLISVLFTGAFLAIIMLYSARADVKETVQMHLPYSYTYVSVSDNPFEQKHTELLRQTLSDKEGYTEYQFTLASQKDGFRSAAVSESEYNAAAKGIGQSEISLNPNQVYVVKDARFDPNVSFSEIDPLIADVYASKGLIPEVLGVSNHSIMPSGMVNTMYVVPDNLIDLAKTQFGDYMRVYAYNIDHWDTDEQASYILNSQIDIDLKSIDTYMFGFFDAYDLYQVEQTSKNLMLYVGGSLSVLFFIAASSMIYFRMITEKEKESMKFKGIVKLGLSQKELSSVISRQLYVLMFVPFAVAMLITLIFTGLFSHEVGGSYMTVAVISTVLFLIIQIIGFSSVLAKYKKVMFKDVYLNELSK